MSLTAAIPVAAASDAPTGYPSLYKYGAHDPDVDLATAAAAAVTTAGRPWTRAAVVCTLALCAMALGSGGAFGSPSATVHKGMAGICESKILQLHTEHIRIEPYFAEWAVAEAAARPAPTEHNPHPHTGDRVSFYPYLADWADEQFGLSDAQRSDMGNQLETTPVPVEPFMAQWAAAQFISVNCTDETVEALYHHKGRVPINHFLIKWAHAQGMEELGELESLGPEATAHEADTDWGDEGAVEPFMAAWARAQFRMPKGTLTLAGDLGMVGGAEIPVEVFLGHWAKAQLRGDIPTPGENQDQFDEDVGFASPH